MCVKDLYVRSMKCGFSPSSVHGKMEKYASLADESCSSGSLGMRILYE